MTTINQYIRNRQVRGGRIPKKKYSKQKIYI